MRTILPCVAAFTPHIVQGEVELDLAVASATPQTGSQRLFGASSSRLRLVSGAETTVFLIEAWPIQSCTSR